LTISHQTPDLVILLVATYRAVVQRLLADMKSARIPGMRAQYGFVIRAVAAEEPTVNRLAELLDVTKQAASKLADNMVRHGFLVRVADHRDRRMSRLRLSTKGRRVRARALATSAALERQVARKVGRAGAVTLRRALLEILARHGGLEDVMAQRARPLW
jgi:DNA-binding MarR family transcriptional regulator